MNRLEIHEGLVTRAVLGYVAGNNPVERHATFIREEWVGCEELPGKPWSMILILQLLSLMAVALLSAYLIVTTDIGMKAFILALGWLA